MPKEIECFDFMRGDLYFYTARRAAALQLTDERLSEGEKLSFMNSWSKGGEIK